MEIIIKGNRGEGKSTLARALYHFCKMLGYDVEIKSLSSLSKKLITDNPFPNLDIMNKKVIIEDMCSYES